MQGELERFLVSTFYTGISRPMSLSLDCITFARDGLLFEPSSNAPIVRAEFIEQGAEAGVVARLQKVHELVHHHELQALERISGQSGVDADCTGFRRARTPACFHHSNAPTRCMDADAGLHALDYTGQRAQHFGAVELVEGGLIYGGLTGGTLTASVPVRGGLT